MDISIKCDSLKAIYSVKNGMLRCAAPYEFTISVMPMIKVCIEEVGNRIITFTCEEEIEAKKLYSLLQELERLLQIFDGVFLDLEAIEIYGRESTNSYNALVEHFKIQRLHYFSSANFISIFRIFVMFAAVYLIYTCQGNTAAYLWALALTIIAFALDGLDGYVARKFHEESKFGALLDIMGDRIVENTYWILFAVMGWLNILFPLIAITRGFITDTIRSAAMEQGLTPFAMQVNPVCKFITGSKFMRISYAVAKVLAFVLIIAAKIPVCPNREIIWTIGFWAAVFAIVFCVVRGLPVVIEAKYLFEKKND